MLHNMSMQYEKGPYNTGAGGGTADYVFALMFAMGMILLTYPLVFRFFPMLPMFCKTLIFFVMYVWSRRNPTSQSNIWGVPIPGVWLPFAYLGLSVAMGNPYFDMIHGLVIGHLYYFLVDVIPQVQGREILVTPAFLIDRIGVGQYQPEVVQVQVPVPNMRPVPGQPVRPAAAAGYQWGATGQRLGRE